MNRLLKQYEQTATIMKQLKKMGPLGMMGLMKKMNGLMGGNGMPQMGMPENLTGNGLFGGKFNPFK